MFASLKKRRGAVGSTASTTTAQCAMSHGVRQAVLPMPHRPLRNSPFIDVPAPPAFQREAYGGKDPPAERNGSGKKEPALAGRAPASPDCRRRRPTGGGSNRSRP